MLELVPTMHYTRPQLNEADVHILDLPEKKKKKRNAARRNIT